MTAGIEGYPTSSNPRIFNDATIKSLEKEILRAGEAIGLSQSDIEEIVEIQRASGGSASEAYEKQLNSTVELARILLELLQKLIIEKGYLAEKSNKRDSESMGY